MIQKKPKELLGAVANMGWRLLAPIVVAQPIISLAIVGWLGFEGVQMYKEHVKEETLKPRIEYSQQMMSDIVQNGIDMCDPARSRPGAAAELRAALERKMFIMPDKIGDAVDDKNVRNGLNMQWANSMGVKLCVDMQMQHGTAVLWHPKERILAVNGGYNVNLLAVHIELALNELARRGGNDRFRRYENGANQSIPPLSEKFSVQTTIKHPASYMFHDESSMPSAMRDLPAPVRPGPKNGS